MAEIRWIQLSTDLFNNRKIKQIRKLPEGDAIIGVWIQILCLAGNSNNGGLVYFSKDIPYTDEMLSAEFDRPLNIIRLSLETFLHFEMIYLIDDVMCVSNWEKYQSINGLAKMQEAHRLRQQRYRDKQKALKSDVSVTSRVTGSSNSISISNSLSLNNKEESLDEERFNEFWSIYPKKTGKKAAFTAWKKAKVNKTLYEQILQTLAAAKESEQWHRNNGQFIPNPATWINQGRWDDEVISVTSRSSNPFDEALKREIENEQNRNNIGDENNKRYIPDVL